MSLSLRNAPEWQHSNHTVQHFAFFLLTIYLRDGSISVHKELPHSFLTAVKISIVRVYGNLFKQSPADGRSGCLQSSVIMNRAAVNSLVHPTLHTYVQVGLRTTFWSRRLYGSTGTCPRRLDRVPNAVHGGCAHLYPPLPMRGQQVQGV